MTLHLHHFSSKVASYPQNPPSCADDARGGGRENRHTHGSTSDCAARYSCCCVPPYAHPCLPPSGTLDYCWTSLRRVRRAYRVHIRILVRSTSTAPVLVDQSTLFEIWPNTALYSYVSPSLLTGTALYLGQPRSTERLLPLSNLPPAPTPAPSPRASGVHLPSSAAPRLGLLLLIAPHRTCMARMVFPLLPALAESCY